MGLVSACICLHLVKLAALKVHQMSRQLFLFAVNPWMCKQPTLDHFDTEEICMQHADSQESSAIIKSLFFLTFLSVPAGYIHNGYWR